MSDIDIRIEGRAGRITLRRPKALNALSHAMAIEIEKALDAWRDSGPDLIVIDAEGEKAFCAGGDIASLYHAGREGNYAVGRDFWRDEYRMNAKLSNYPKPIVSLMQGFIMGGGVGVGCHVSHRIVGESSQIAMPECGIGLIPDVGGTLLLARAPGQIGTYLGLTGARIGAGDAIYTGFADHFVPEADWPGLIDTLCESGDVDQIPTHPAPDAPLAESKDAIDAAFAGDDLSQMIARGAELPGGKALLRNSPLSMAATLRLLDAAREEDTIEAALAHEFRYTYRAVEHSDFLEGVRAAIIDKDRSPTWMHASVDDLPADLIDMMTAPLGEERLILEDPA